MKALIQLALLAAAIYAGYWYYQNHYLAAEAAAAPTESAEPSGPTQIVCPSCGGEGRHTYVDRQGRNHRYPCQVCGFSGSRTVSLPESAHLCPDCKGMGRCETQEKRRNVQGGFVIDAARCQRCAGMGYIQPRAQPGRQTPTR